MSAADLARARKLATAAADDVETRPDAAMARAAAAEALIALDLAEKNAAFHALIDGQETAPPPAPQITAEWLAANPWLLADPERLATREQLASAPAGTVVETESGYRFRQAAGEGWTTGVGSVFDGAVTVGDLLEAGARIVEKPLPVHPVPAAPEAISDSFGRLATLPELQAATDGTIVETPNGHRWVRVNTGGNLPFPWRSLDHIDSDTASGYLYSHGARIVEKPLPHTVDAPAWPPLAGATREIRTARYALREVVRIVRDAEGELDRPAYGSALSWVRYGQSQLDRAEAALMGQSAPAASASASTDGPRREQPANQHETYRALFEAVLRAAAEAHSTRSQAQFAAYRAACEGVDAAAREHVTALLGPATGGVIAAPGFAVTNLDVSRALIAHDSSGAYRSPETAMRATLQSLVGHLGSTGGYEPAKLAPGSVVVAGWDVYACADIGDRHRWIVLTPGGFEWVTDDRVPTDGVLVVDGATLGGSR